MLTIKHVENANKDYFLCQQNNLTYFLFDLRPYFCLGSLEIRKIGILFSDKFLTKPKITFMLSGYFSMTRKLIVLFKGILTTFHHYRNCCQIQFEYLHLFLLGMRKWIGKPRANAALLIL